jgi:zinc protease
MPLAAAFSASHSVHQLDNGLTVFIAPRKDTPLVSLQFSIRHGYAYAQGSEYEGIAHFYEHMLFKANSLTESQAEFMRALSGMGSVEWNGTTSRDHVTYFLTVPAAEFENALRLWSAVLIDTIFDEEEIRREVSVVSNEIEGNRRIPQRVLWRELNNALYRDLYRTGHYDTGALKGFTREILEREKNHWYVPNNSLVSLSGAINEAEALELVKKYFGHWQRGENAPPVRPLLLRARASQQGTAQEDARILQGFPNPEMATLIIAWDGPITRLHRVATFAADVLAEIISENSGPYLRELVEATPLFSIDSTSFSFYTGRFASEFIFQGRVAITNTDTLMRDARQAFNAVNELLADIAEGRHAITRKDIERVVQRNINTRIFRHEKPNSLLRDLNWCWAIADLQYFLDYERSLAAVSIEEIQRLAARWLAQPGLEFLWVHESVAAGLAATQAKGDAE